MGAFNNGIRAMFRRPFIIVFFGLLTLVFCYIDYTFNPISTLLFGVSSMGGADILEGLKTVIHLISNVVPQITSSPMVLVAILVFIVFVSVFVSLIFSGYFNVLNNSLNGKPKIPGDFANGIRKYFLRMFFVSFMVLGLSIIFILFIAVAVVPAITVTTAVTGGKAALLIPALLLDFVTLVVVFFGIMFFRIYMFFWFPAVLSGANSGFATGKRTADAHFWSIVGRFMVFDIVFVIYESIFLYTNYAIIQQKIDNLVVSVVLFAADWIFKTFFFASYITYVFSAFKMFREKGR